MTYYVAPTGSDSAPGTPNAPFATIQKAANIVKAGDTVHVAAGDYAGFSRYGLKGTSLAPVTFMADGPVNIVSKAAAQTQLNCGIELSGQDASSGCAFVTVSGFNVNNASGTIGGPNSSGIRVRFSHDIIVANCVAQNCGWVGLYAAYVQNVSFIACRSLNNNGFVDASTGRNHGIYIANSCTACVVSHCLVSGNNGNGIHLNGDGGVNSGFIIDGNIIRGSGKNGGSAINCDGLQNSTISNNLLDGNTSKGIALYNIDATDSSNNNKIAHNTVIMAATSGNAAIQIKPDSDGNVLTSNIFVAQNTTAGNLTDFASNVTITQHRNIWCSAASKPFRSDGSGLTWAEFAAKDDKFLTAIAQVGIDPTRHLTAISPARGYAAAGAAVWDMESVPREDPADCGCYRYLIPGDVNCDGLVTGDDAAVVQANIGRSYALDPVGGGWVEHGDPLRDGRVDKADLDLVQANMGRKA